MNRAVLALLLLVVSIGHSRSAQAQAISFTSDSIRVIYARCLGDSGIARVSIVNGGSTNTSIALRFEDVDQSWFIRRTEWGDSTYSAIELASGDTFWVELAHQPKVIIISPPFVGWYSDTLEVMSAAGNDKIVLHARRTVARMVASENVIDLGLVPQGGVDSAIIWIRNSGDAAWIPDFEEKPKTGWEVIGVGLGDTVLPGDSVSITLRFSATAIVGRQSFSHSLYSPCGLLRIDAVVKVYPPRAHWTVVKVADTIQGCPQPSEYSIRLRNSSQEDTWIDSVRFLDASATDWMFATSAIDSFLLEAGSSRPFPIFRSRDGQSTKVVVYSKSAVPDTIDVVSYQIVGRPTIRNYRDTVFLTLGPKDSLRYVVSVRNRGSAYRLTSATLVGNALYQLESFDTVPISGTREADVVFRFAGAEPGVYHAQLQLQGTPCDTLLVQNYVIQVLAADVVDDVSDDSRLQIYPTLVNNLLTIEAERGGRYDIVDARGAIVHIGVLEHGATRLAMTDLPNGQYFVRLMLGSETLMRAFIVRR